jgi:NADH-quinone oxidoreductase subunit F
LIEGMLIAAYALGSQAIYCYTRGEYKYLIDIMDAAIEEARAAGLIGKTFSARIFLRGLHAHGSGRLHLRRRNGVAFVARRNARASASKPPFPAVEGLYASPTIVNNVETLMAVPYIITNGGEAYKALGTEKAAAQNCGLSPGMSCIRAYTNCRWATTWKSLSSRIAAGFRTGKTKAVIPGGSSVYIMPAEDIIGKMSRWTMKVSSSRVRWSAAAALW